MMQPTSGKFPFGKTVTENDEEILRISRSLEGVISELSGEIVTMWHGDQSNGPLGEAGLRLTRAGVSLCRDVVRFGNIVVRRIEPYWLTKALLEEQHVEAIKAVATPRITQLLDDALQLEERIRSRLP